MEHLHVRIPNYQAEFFEENPFTKSEVVRMKIDDFMIEEGADPEEWKNMHGE